MKRYLEHENSLESEGYVRMFQEKIDILKAYKIKSALDYGCGYAPVLKNLLERQGIQTEGYDPNFFPDTSPGKLYDLVISTETFEHFRNPSKEITLITEKLVPEGILAIMTRFYPAEDKNFADWYYKRDPTHIIFYCPTTFQWIAESRGFKLIFNNGNDFVVLKKILSKKSK